MDVENNAMRKLTSHISLHMYIHVNMHQNMFCIIKNVIFLSVNYVLFNKSVNLFLLFFKLIALVIVNN